MVVCQGRSEKRGNVCQGKPDKLISDFRFSIEDFSNLQSGTLWVIRNLQ